MKQCLENAELIVEVDDHGAELSRIFDKKRNREVLWSGDPAYWGRRAPLLFPNVGRHWQDQYRIGGNSYPSSQHGFARDLDFTCKNRTENRTEHLLASDENTLKKYPFPFRLQVIHTLNGRELTVTWEVENPGETPMYFTIGGHPAFRVPDGMELKEIRLSFPQKNCLTYLLIDPEGKGTVDFAHPHTLALQDGICLLDQLKDGEEVLADRMFDRDALVFDGGQISDVRLLLPDGSCYVRLSGEDFPCFGIWSAPGAPFVCLEPWMGRADDVGYTGTLDQKSYINTVNPKDCFRKSYCIEI